MDQAVHQRCSVIHGASQARTARSARGQDGAGGAAAGPPLSAAGSWLRSRGLRWVWLISEPCIPAEGERAVDQRLVPADGEVGADLEISPAQLVLDLLVRLLDPVADRVKAHDLGQGRGRVRAARPRGGRRDGAGS